MSSVAKPNHETVQDWFLHAGGYGSGGIFGGKGDAIYHETGMRFRLQSNETNMAGHVHVTAGSRYHLYRR
jgi:hypothetical protein